MKRIAALFVFSVLFAPLAARSQNSAPAAEPAASAPGAASFQAPQGRKKRVAVFDFDYATVRTNSAALFGTDIDIGKGIADLLVKNLVTDGTYSVIERKQLDKILAEQNFSNSDRANPASAAKIGKILGLDAIIVGSITEFGNETKNTNVGGGGGNFHGFGVGGFGHKDSKANVMLDARLVDIDTAEILGVAEGKGQSKRSSTSMLGGGQEIVPGMALARAGRGLWIRAIFNKAIINQVRAVKAATDEMTAGVIAAAWHAQAAGARHQGREALVAKAVDGGRNRAERQGAKTGIKVGDHMSVERITSTIKDLGYRGEFLRRDDHEAGRAGSYRRG